MTRFSNLFRSLCVPYVTHMHIIKKSVVDVSYVSYVSWVR